MRANYHDLLVEKGIVSRAHLQSLLEKHSGRDVMEVLAEAKLATERRLLEIKAECLRVPFVDLKHFAFKSHLVKALPESYSRTYHVIVLSEKPGGYVVGMAEPNDLQAMDAVSRILGSELDVTLVDRAQLELVVDKIYRRTDEITECADALSAEMFSKGLETYQSEDDLDDADTPIAQLIEKLFEDAMQVGASDIHIEPNKNGLRVRFRIDGMLQENFIENKTISAAVTQRLKLMAKLNIAEKRLPQDGRFQLTMRHQVIDVRLSTMPIQHGESVVMRILAQSGSAKSLSELGMPQPIVEKFSKLIHRPQGMVIVTGPTGSGKTTTLYSALQALNVPERKIITAEDPVEYRLDRVNQVQVQSELGLTFSTVLRTILRQDPDVILVGEIRDSETAGIALRAAMTGHLVLATLHTNDAASSAMRLLDMGAEGYLVASALNGIMAQRLIRRICDACKTPHTLSVKEQTWLKVVSKKYRYSLQDAKFYSGKGCQHCHNSGYSGRIGVYEFLQLTDRMAEALRKNDPDDFESTVYSDESFKPFGICGLDVALEGSTTIEEVMRIAEDLGDS